MFLKNTMPCKYCTAFMKNDQRHFRNFVNSRFVIRLKVIHYKVFTACQTMGFLGIKEFKILQKNFHGIC